MSSKTNQDPDRGFSKFFVNWRMIADYHPCMWWEQRITKEDILLTKQAVSNLLSHQPAPVWWILARLRTKYVDRYPQAFFDDLWTALHRKSDALFESNVHDKAYNIEMARTLLNYLYDNNHNNVVEPSTTIYQRRTFYLSPGTRMYQWTQWMTITKAAYERLLLQADKDVQLRTKTHYRSN